MYEVQLKTRPYHILLAEDDADDRELFLEAIALVDPAIQVKTVENGEILISYLKEAVVFPDCIFLDLNMPRKNGKQCLVEIRRNKSTEKIPIVIYTTSPSNRDIDETYNQGASCFIRKPNSFEELKELLDRYVKSSFQDTAPKRLRHDFVLNARP